jgi:hypothetical protein
LKRRQEFRDVEALSLQAVPPISRTISNNWGFPLDHPMTAPNYAAIPSDPAKNNELGRKQRAPKNRKPSKS